MLELTVRAFSSTEITLDRPANYYLVESPEVKVLIDAGPKKEPVKEAFEADYVVLTHFHWDHTRGIVGLSEVGIPVCANPLTIKLMDPEISSKRMLRVSEALNFKIDEVEEPVRGIFNAYASFFSEIADSIKRVKTYDVNECPGLKKLKAKVLACPGHSDDHICIIIGEHSFIGDNLIAKGSVTVIDLGSYMRSLFTLLSDTSWKIAHPGHGKQSLTREEFREEFLDEILGKVRRLSTVAMYIGREWRSLRDLLLDVYKGLDRFLMYIAARSLVGYIEILERMGLVEVDRNESPWRVRMKEISPSPTA